MADRPHIVVVGGGLGGLTAALCLAKSGFRVTVCERAEELSEIGAGIQIAPNAGRVLAAIGLGEAVAAAAVEPEAIEFRAGASGRLITAIPTARFRQRYGFPYHVLRRADLQSVLAAAVSHSPHICLRMATTVTGFVEAGDTVTANADDTTGPAIEPAIALIAADGARSSLRPDVNPDSAATPTGRTAWRAIVPASAAGEVVAADRVGLWLAPHAHLVHYPISRGEAVNLVVVLEEQWNQPGWSVPAAGADLTPVVADWSAAARQLVRLPDAWQKFAVHTVDPAGSWWRGRVALLGDAAHAMSPFLAQGAAMAIEDAAVLAHTLRANSDVGRALAAYQEERRPRIVRLAAAAERAGRIYHFGAAAAAVRDLVLAAGGARLPLGRYDWIYRWRPPDLPPRPS